MTYTVPSAMLLKLLVFYFLRDRMNNSVPGSGHFYKCCSAIEVFCSNFNILRYRWKQVFLTEVEWCFARERVYLTLCCFDSSGWEPPAFLLCRPFLRWDRHSNIDCFIFVHNVRNCFVIFPQKEPPELFCSADHFSDETDIPTKTVSYYFVFPYFL